jgi:hypothetical protein
MRVLGEFRHEDELGHAALRTIAIFGNEGDAEARARTRPICESICGMNFTASLKVWSS